MQVFKPSTYMYFDGNREMARHKYLGKTSSHNKKKRSRKNKHKILTHLKMLLQIRNLLDICLGLDCDHRKRNSEGIPINCSYRMFDLTNGWMDRWMTLRHKYSPILFLNKNFNNILKNLILKLSLMLTL